MAVTWTISAFADEAGASCDEQIVALKEAGISHIDMRSVDGFNISVLPVENARRVRAKLDAAGIKVHMLGSPLGKIDIADDFKIDQDKLAHLATLAPILGCNVVRIFSYYNKAKKPEAEFHQETLRRLDALAQQAKELGLILYHENESEIMGDKARDVFTIMKTLRQKYGGATGTFRMIFDFGNYNAGKENVWENWLLLRETTDAIHLKDNQWVGDKMQHVPAGEGDGYVEKILADAVARGFAGPVVIEPHLQHSPAVLATGPSGQANQSLANMTANECFQVACTASKAICKKVGAQLR